MFVQITLIDCGTDFLIARLVVRTQYTLVHFANVHLKLSLVSK